MKKIFVVLAALFLLVVIACSSSGGGDNPTPKPKSSEKSITAFSLNGVGGTINESEKTIAVTMPSGTNVTALVAIFTTTGASVVVDSTPQVSGTTDNDFTSPVIYTVVAHDATIQEYTVTVIVAAKSITAFSLNGVAGTINETAKTIAVTMPTGTSVTALVATFTTTGTGVKIGSTVQVSGTTANNFTNPVVYTVTGEDATTQDYTVTVTGLTPSFSSAGTWTGANGNGDSIKVVNEFVTYIYSAAWELTFTFYSGAGSPCRGSVFTSEFDNYPWTNNGRDVTASVGITGGGTINMTFSGTSPNSAVVTWQASAQLCGKPVDNTWTVTKQ